jgi:P27 family predicted phage terminase small subunit
MAGRKPIPTNLKLIRGTARPHRINRDEPTPPISTPEPPAHLDERARTKFTELAGLLAGCGVMTDLDRDALARYCVIWCRWIDAEAEIKRKGPIVKTAAGNIIHSPYLAVANRCHRQLAQLEGEFGLTPSSRSRVRATAPAVPSDPIADRYFDW